MFIDHQHEIHLHNFNVINCYTQIKYHIKIMKLWELPLHTALPVDLAYYVLQALLKCSKTLSWVFSQNFC